MTTCLPDISVAMVISTESAGVVSSSWIGMIGVSFLGEFYVDLD